MKTTFKAGRNITNRMDRFKYLRSVIADPGDTYKYIINRIRTLGLKWKTDEEIDCDKHLPVIERAKFNKILVRLTMLYTSECWAVNQAHVKNLACNRGEDFTFDGR